MRFRILVIAALILGVFALQLTAAAITKRPPATITKAALNPNAVRVAGTQMKGTISVMGTLPTELKTMTCSDIKVYLGKFTTPAPPPGSDLNLSIPVFQEMASAAGMGGIPSCSYTINFAPFGQELDILVVANQEKFNCTRTSLIMQPPYPKITLPKGQVTTKNFQVTPNCEILK